MNRQVLAPAVHIGDPFKNPQALKQATEVGEIPVNSIPLSMMDRC